MQYLDYLYKQATYVDLTVDWTTKNVKQIGFKKADFSKIEDVLTKLLKAEKDSATRMLYTKAFSRFSKTYHHSRLYSGTELFTMTDTKKCSDVFVTAFIPNSEMLQYAIDKHLRH